MKFSQYNVYTKVLNDFVIFNTLTRSVIKISQYQLNELKTNLSFLKFSSEDFKKNSPNLTSLLDLGFVLENDIDEFLLFKYWYNKEKFKHNLLVITLLITSKCNMSCIYCFEGDFKNQNISLDYITFKKIKTFISYLIKMWNPKILDLNLFGGEPTLNLNLIKLVIKDLNYLTQKNNVQLQTNIVTNGLLLNPKNLDAFKKIGINSFQITLDGTKSTHDQRRHFINGKGTYDIIYKNLIIAIEKEFKIILNMNFDNNNYKSIIEFLKILPMSYRKKIIVSFSPIKVTQKNLNMVHKFPNEKIAQIWYLLNKCLIDEKYDLSDIEYEQYGPCTFLRNSFITIDPQGNLGKCIYGIGDKEYNLGNINENFSDIIKKFSQYISVEPFFTPQCKKCNYLPLCLGGCRRENILETGMKNNLKCNKSIIENGFIKLLKYYFGKL